MNDHEALRERWLHEQPIYDRLAKRVEAILAAECRRRGLPCELKSRAKNVSSFVKKVIRKDYADAYEEIHDKAGVRIIYPYPDALASLEEVVRLCLVELHYENKKLKLEYDQLGYLGVHFEVTLPESSLDAGDEHRDLICEVQLHTRAQSLWAELEHQLSYKPAQEPPAEVKRAIRRLVALVEIFDEEVSRSRHTLLTQEGFQEARVLECLEKHYYKYTARPFDRQLSLIVLDALKERFFAAELEVVCRDLDGFVEGHDDKLSEIFQQYADDERSSPLLFQPEALLIFELLQTDPFVLKEVWAKRFPVTLLESLALVWGMSVGS